MFITITAHDFIKWMLSSTTASHLRLDHEMRSPPQTNYLFDEKISIHIIPLFTSYSHSKNLCVYPVTTSTMKPSTAIAILSLTGATSAMFIPSTVYFNPFPPTLL